MKVHTKTLLLVLFIMLFNTISVQGSKLTTLSGDDLIFYEDTDFDNGTSGFTTLVTKVTTAPGPNNLMPAGSTAEGETNLPD